MDVEDSDVELEAEKRQKLKSSCVKERWARKTRREGEQEGQWEVEKEDTHPQNGGDRHRPCFARAAPELRRE